MPQPGLDALTRYWEGQSTRGVLNEPDYFPVIDHAREKMARLLGADECEVGWVQNTATAIALVANGLDWRSGDNVVTVHGEFPANVYPWLGLRRWGVETRFVQKNSGCVSIYDIAALMDERTRLLSISFVEFNTGVRNDLAALGQLCEERGILFNVDAIQGLGALRMDPHGWGIHFLGAGAHKWLLGPQGVGVLYVRKDVLERLNLFTANWYGVIDKHDHLNYGQPWIESAARVEGSTPNVSGVVAFDAVLKMMLDVGPARIEERVLCLSGRLMDGLLARGYDVVSSPEPDKRSGVVCFKAKGDPMDLLARAEAEKIVIAVRVGVVRVSPHFYNTEEEIDRLLALL
jgi:selenocysteine lyase/cysteine desulfurase